MKKMKRFASLALALVMALAMMAPVFAANGGTITVTNATKDVTYSIYKIFDATYSGTDNKNASYTITEESKWYSLVDEAKDLFTLTPVNTKPGTYNVALVKEKGASDITAWLKTVTLPAENEGEMTATSATVEFTGLAYGYYLVKSSLNDGGTLTLDNANPDATVIDKNQEPGTPAKKVTDGVLTDGSAEIGEEMKFEISYIATNYNKDKKVLEYTIKDNMPDGMTWIKKDQVEVYVGDKKLEENKDYTLTADTTDDEDDFTVVIPWVTKTGNAYAYTDELKYASPSTIKVVYYAIMNENAAIDGTGNKNEATISYIDIDKDGPTPGDPTEVTTEETVFTYALAIKKVDKEGNPLAGAKFTLEQNGRPVTVKEVSIATDSTEANVYVVDADGKAEIVSPASGLIIIKGVEGAEYTLTETEAPEGYNLLTEPVKVTPKKTGETTTTVTKYIDENGDVIDEETDVEVKVVNNDVAATVTVVVNFTGSLLPSTGGIGTTIFYVVGGILVAGAAILLVTRKRVEEQ